MILLGIDIPGGGYRLRCCCVGGYSKQDITSPGFFLISFLQCFYCFPVRYLSRPLRSKTSLSFRITRYSRYFVIPNRFSEINSGSSGAD